jgi:hypothetical protein
MSNVLNGIKTKLNNSALGKKLVLRGRDKKGRFKARKFPRQIALEGERATRYLANLMNRSAVWTIISPLLKSLTSMVSVKKLLEDGSHETRSKRFEWPEDDSSESTLQVWMEF